jgi:hypothetical protein
VYNSQFVHSPAKQQGNSGFIAEKKNDLLNIPKMILAVF